MTITVKPIHQNPLPDDPVLAAQGYTTPTEYNEGSAIEMATARLLGRVSESPGSAEELTADQARVLLSLGSAYGFNKATTANLRARTVDTVLTPDVLPEAKAAVALVYAATRSLDWREGWFRTCTLTGNMVLANPTNVEPGDTIVLRLIGSSTVERTVSFGTNYKGPFPTDAVSTTKGLLISLFAASATEIHPSWKAFTL